MLLITLLLNILREVAIVIWQLLSDCEYKYQCQYNWN